VPRNNSAGHYKHATSDALGIEQRNFNPYMSFVDSVKRSLKNGGEAGYLKFDHVNKGLCGTHTSKSLSSTGSAEEYGDVGSPGAIDVHASDAHKTHTGPIDGCDKFIIFTKTSHQETLTTFLSFPELVPQIPRANYGSSASGFTSHFMESMSGIFDGDDEQHEVHSATTMQPREPLDEKGL
jgi:hypothetical protein